jgi:hypothetical protein
MIEWETVKYFSKSEFSEDPDKCAKPNLIYSINTLRGLCNCPIHPSPVSGALARTSGSKKSRHYAIDRKSDALDFLVKGDFFPIFCTIISCRLFRGIGVYFDGMYNGKPAIRYHVDLREKGLNIFEPLIWFQEEKGEGVKYPQSNESDLYSFRTCFHKHI